MKKVSIGSWAISMELPELCKGLADLKFDGISMGGFKPHANPELYETKEKRDGLLQLLKDNNLEVADYAADTWSITNSVQQSEEWLALYDQAVEFMDMMDWRLVRIDTGMTPNIPDGYTYAQCREKITENFIHCAKKAKQYGITVAWEFEPGFMISEPKYVVETVKNVGEANFGVLVDTCHAHMSSVIGANHIEEGCTLKGGIVEFLEMLSGKITHIHLIDSDGSLNGENTSTHVPFGGGDVDFDTVIPAIIEKGGYKGDWWSIDLCEWPDAWKATADCKKFVDGLNEKFCK